MSTLDSPAATLDSFSQSLSVLMSIGWMAQDGLSSVALTSPPDVALSDLLLQTDSLRAATTDARFIGAYATAEVRLRRLDGAFLVDRLPSEAPEALFVGTELKAAERLWADVSEAAFELPFTWRVEIELDLRALWEGARSDLDLRVALKQATVLTSLMSQPYWSLGKLLPARGCRRVFIALDAPDEIVHLGSMSFAGPFADLSTFPSHNLPHSLAERPDLELELPDLPSPADVLPLSRSLPSQSSWGPALLNLRRAAAAMAWCQLASEVKSTPQGPILSFRGYRRVSWPLFVAPENSRDVLDLHAWVFAEPSPDRLLAVQQVTSLQHENDLHAAVGDLRASAEIVYAGLRNDAVAEVVKGYRDAQAAALDSVRQTLKGVQDVTKAATDRAFAALVAVGGVLIAKAGTTLPDEASRQLLLVVAGFLALLAIFSIFIEGPLVSSSLKHLKDDLASGSPLLNREQTDRLADLKAVGDARDRARTIRVVIPLFHLLTALGIIIFAVPAKY